MDKSKPSYYGILPAHVRYDNDLPPMARIMYAEITALSNKDGYCSAGNDYFAKLYDVSTVTVSRWVSKLGKQGHISIDADPVTGHDRKLYPLNKNVVPLNKNVKAPIQKDQGPLNKNVKHNSTSIILQDNSNSKSEDLPEDVFKNIEGLKAKIGPKHYEILNEACQDKKGENYLNAHGMFRDGRFGMMMDWLEHKKNVRKGLKVKGSITELINLFANYTPKEIELAVKTAKANGWAAVFPKALSDKQVSAQAQQGQPSAKVKNILANGRRKADVV